MLAASHALIGAAIATTVPDPWLGFPLAILSHFLIDLFPHWDAHTRHTNRTKPVIIVISLTDAFIGFFLGWLIFSSSVNQSYLFTMMFISQLPDWIEAPYHVFDWHFFPFSSIKNLQSRLHFKLNWPWGLYSQVILVIIIVLLARL
ncbi:MAG: hypothetical protein V1810_03295 [Candidatus Beckwithbacteria bacterium]